MIRTVVRESSYRFRATFRRRWTGYLTLVVLIALVGGVAMAAVAGARRTQSSFPAYLASTNPSDVGCSRSSIRSRTWGTRRGWTKRWPGSPAWQRPSTVIGFDGKLQVLGHSRHGRPGRGTAYRRRQHGSDGEYYSTDKVTVVQGRMADPDRMDEMVMSSGAAAQYGLHLGSTLSRGHLHHAQAGSPNFSRLPEGQALPHRPLQARRHHRGNPQVVEDDDAALGNQLAVSPPR